MAAGLATPQDVRLNEPGPICQDSKKRRSFAGEYACLGMRSLRVRFEKVYAWESILAQKPRCPTGNARTRERLRIARMRDLGFPVERKPSARSELPGRGSIRGIPRFSCQNLVFAVYFLREEARYLSNIRRIPKHPDLLVELSSWPAHSA